MLQAIGITNDYVNQLNGWINSIFDEIEEDRGKLKGEKLKKAPRPKTSSLIVVEKFILTYKILRQHPDSFTLCVSFQMIKSPLANLAITVYQKLIKSRIIPPRNRQNQEILVPDWLITSHVT